MQLSIWRISWLGIMCTLLFFVGNKLPQGLWHIYSALSSCLVYPLLYSYQSVASPIHKSLYAYFHAQELEQQVEQLQHQNNQLFNQLVTLKTTEWYTKNSAELTKEIHRYPANKAHIAPIMVRHFSEQEHSILVEAGSRVGITVDMIAIYNNSLVGRVVQVYPWYSKVVLITDVSCKIAALCSDAQVNGIHEGTNTELTSIKYMNDAHTLVSGDLVVSSGQGTVFPYGFGIGTVAYVQQEGATVEVKVVPAVDFKTIKQCILVARADIYSAQEYINASA